MNRAAPFVILAAAAWVGPACALDRLEQHAPIHVQCYAQVQKRVFAAPLGGSSLQLCRALLQRCANEAGVQPRLAAMPQRLNPPYTVCG